MSLKMMANYDVVPGDLTKPNRGLSRKYSLTAGGRKKTIPRKGRCACCERRVRIKQDNRTYKHGTGGFTCDGSGAKPLDIEVVCPDCGRPTAFCVETRRLNAHALPYFVGSSANNMCASSGYKIKGFSGSKVYIEP